MKICPTCQTRYADDVEFCPKDGMKLRREVTQGEDPMLGRALEGRWIIERKIGEGGMGSVYEGSQRSVNRKVAIKTLRRSMVDNVEFVERFFKEAKIATTIAHPHCVTILDFGQDEDGTLFLAMEFLDGQPLSDLMKAGPIPPSDVIKIGVQVASALSAAHQMQIIHRDMKPDNIFMLDIPGGGTFIKVLDFGIAKALDANDSMTKTGQVFGTPEYMSPEQCSGKGLDGRSDLYSVGCILYEMLIGKTPFEGPSVMAVLMAHVSQAVPPPSELGIQVPPGLEAIVMRLLEKDPDRRFSSAIELREALEAEAARIDAQGVYMASSPTPRTTPATQPISGNMDAMAFQDTANETPGVTPEMLSHVPHQHTMPIGGDDSVPPPPTSKLPLVIGGVFLLVACIGLGFVAVVMLGPKNTDPVDPAPVASEASDAKGASDTANGSGPDTERDAPEQDTEAAEAKGAAGAADTKPDTADTERAEARDPAEPDSSEDARDVAARDERSGRKKRPGRKKKGPGIPVDKDTKEPVDSDPSVDVVVGSKTPEKKVDKAPVVETGKTPEEKKEGKRSDKTDDAILDGLGF